MWENRQSAVFCWYGEDTGGGVDVVLFEKITGIISDSGTTPTSRPLNAPLGQPRQQYPVRRRIGKHLTGGASTAHEPHSAPQNESENASRPNLRKA
jgi:hypothetical protein